jgi:formamidopyrimidine-DNA glycosylase
MPELPEVETIRRELAPDLNGRRILNARIGRPDIVGWPKAAELSNEIAGARIEQLERRGKYLILRLDKGRMLVIHLRLSGQLQVVRSSAGLLRFERIRFDMSGGRSLVFVEPRVLGRVYLVEDSKLPPVLKGLQAIGLEPIDRRFTARHLRELVQGRKAAIKALLLDQRIAAGIGNIYSDEALFRARVRPMRSASRMTEREFQRLAPALRRVLKEGIRHMGTTMSDSRYQRPGNRPGGFQNRLMVFDREEQPCRKCGTRIRACRVGGRTSRYCPKCQV